MRIVALANQKGGVGKTTTAVNLGAALAELGHRILLIDLDPQANATSSFGLQGTDGTSLYDPLLGGASITEEILPTRRDGLFIVPADIDLAETARAAEFFQADGVIVSGSATGCPTDPDEVRAAAQAVSIPTLVGSGVTPENIQCFDAADALIVGSSVKEGGQWWNPLDATRVATLAGAFQSRR